jgi:PKD repeat protein
MKMIKTLLLSLVPFCLFSQKINSVQSISGDITLSIIASWTADTAKISFQSGATFSVDAGLDILKSTPSNTTDPVISTISCSQDLYKNSLPTYQDIIDVPIRVKVGITGKYILQMDSNAVLYSGSCVTLEDLAMSHIHDLKSNSSYSFSIEDTTNAPRFILHIGRAPVKTSVAPDCAYNANGMGIMSSYSSGNWDCTWMDAWGNTLMNNTNISGADTLKNLAPGIYPISVSGNSGFCFTTYNDTIVIDSVIPVTVNALVNHVNCPGANTGIINAFMAMGGQAPYSYAWSNSSSNPVIQNLSAGIYTLVLSDAYGCNDTTIYTVQQLSNLSVNFNMSSDTVSMAAPTVTFTNQTTGYTNISWNFGDGSPFSNTYSPTHTYSSGGTFTVELTANDSFCVLKKQEVLTVLNPTGISSNQITDNVKIYGYDGNAIVKFDLSSGEALIRVYSLDGKLVNSKRAAAEITSEEIKLGEAKGIYFVEVEIGNNRIVKKIIN